MIHDIHGQLVLLPVAASAALLWLVSAPFYALGWLAGFLVRCVLWAVAALVAGYRQGLGA